MQEHLDLACIKLNSTQIQLDEQRAQLVETQAELSLLTQDQLKNAKECQEKIRKLEEKLSALQRQIDIKANTDNDGGNKRFIWKIKSFGESLRLAKIGVTERIESDPFYTGCYGYKLKVFARLYFMEYLPIIDPHLSIGIVLMEGEYDEILSWPFSQRIKFTIIDQNKDLKERQNHISYLSPSKVKRLFFGRSKPLFSKRPEGKKMVVEGELPCFISHEKLQTRRYIVNDTLFLQVDVGPDE